MAETVTVASRAHTSISIREPMPKEFLDKPGLAPPLKTFVLVGASDPATKGPVGITRDVDAATFTAWLDEQKASHSPLVDLVHVVSDEDAAKEDPTEYGFEPGLARLSADSANVEKAAKGSSIKDGAPVSAADMKPTSDTPNDDSPRGDPTPPGAAPSQTPATALVAPPA